MTVPSEIFPRDKVHPVRGAVLVRTLNRFLPLGRKYHPLLRLLNNSQHLLKIPFNKYQVLKPAAWIESITLDLLLGPDLALEFEPLKPLCRRCERGQLIDVGANIGLYTLLFRATSSLPIIAYEPQPFLFNLLQWNIMYNNLSDVEARNLACGDRRGQIAFSTGLNGSVVAENSAKTSVACSGFNTFANSWKEAAQRSLAGGIVNVPVTTLDEDLADIEKIALLKIDCEGFEFQILQGAHQLLKRHHPLLFVEVHPEQLVQFGHSAQELLKLLAPDYELEFWYFQIGRHASKLARSLAKFRRPKAHRCADAAEMLTAAKSIPGPAQIYFIGRPK
jgi:FkbM family methyltransferase